MSIPDYQSCMLPLLEFASDGLEHTMAEAVERLSERFGLTPEEREELLPSGAQFVIANRIGWAKTYMKKAGLLSDPRRGCFRITDRGRELLKTKPERLSSKDLMQYEEFNAFRKKSLHKALPSDQIEEHPLFSTPEEALEYGFQKLMENLADEIMEKIMSCSPAFFERLVIALLVKMGYGGSLKEASSIVGKAGDEGIDGIIKEDKLGLDVIYVQAKRWTSVVGRPEIQKFAGALLGQKAAR